MSREVYHLIGVGGIGMSALARLLLQKGAQIQGSDAAASPLLEALQKEGAQIRVGHVANAVEGATAVVYSSAVREDNVELIRAQQLGLPRYHRSELLDRIARAQSPLLVTGTHGKTTTSSLLAAVLLTARDDPSFALGGILRPWNTNGRLGRGRYFVMEADESDGSFLRTPAFGAIVTNLENDHLDYWGTEEKLDAAFRQFFEQVSSTRHLFWCGDDSRLRRLEVPGIAYGFGARNELQVTGFVTTESGIQFDLLWQGVEYRAIELALWGRHNALNGAAVFGLALSLGVSEESIRAGFRAFGGAARRLEWKGKAHAVDVYDDYGHHPTEIQATLQALRTKVRERRIVVAFQPHRYTRLRDHFDAFTRCFQEADVVALTDVYSAGEPPKPGVSSQALALKMAPEWGSRLHYFPRSELEKGVAALLQPHDVLLTIGAGDITKTGDPILSLYQERAPRLKVALLFGGASAEHEVSLQSARTIGDGLNPHLYDVHWFGVSKEGRWAYGPDAMDKISQKQPLPETIAPEILQQLARCDLAIPVFHGPQGEDGMFQGFLDVFHIPYVGCDYRACALTMHKGWTKQIAAMAGVPTAPSLLFSALAYSSDLESVLRSVEEQLSFPVWVKPVHLGSSIGVRRAATPFELKEALQGAFVYDDEVLVEKEIVGIQVEYAVMGNDFLRIAPSCEILNRGFHDFASKYGPTASGYAIPARIPPFLDALGRSLALTMYQASGCQGIARVDFFVDESGHFWLNEINPFPGYTPTSAYPAMWNGAGMEIGAQCDEMVLLALHRHRKGKRIRGR